MYEFWYGSLCDVYLEAIKPIMQLDDSSISSIATKHATQTVLHACLHYGLRMLHPFMPFVTEELFQRLQLLCGEPRSSIMNQPFPVPGAVSAWKSDKVIAHELASSTCREGSSADKASHDCLDCDDRPDLSRVPSM